MPAEGEERRRARKEKGEESKRKKSPRGGGTSRKKGGRGTQPSNSGIFGWCFDVCPCSAGSTKISANAKAQEDKERRRRREKEKKDREKKKKKDREEEDPDIQRDAGSDRGAGDDISEEDGCMTARSDATSCYTSRSEYTGAGTERSTRSAKDKARDRREAAMALAGGAGGGSRPSSQRAPEKAPNSSRRGAPIPEQQEAPPKSRGGGGGGEIQVLSLADLRGKELPDYLNGGGGDGSQSARSCQSDARSVRSDAVKSVASTSVKQYMGHLSERKSSAEVKKMVKNFVREMIKGREMSVLRADGALRPVTCGLSRQLDVFRIKSGEVVRKLKLKDIERVVRGPSEDFADLETPLDESCSTLELESSECISFKFAERKKAELFTMCMSLFLDGQKG